MTEKNFNYNILSIPFCILFICELHLLRNLSVLYFIAYFFSFIGSIYLAINWYNYANLNTKKAFKILLLIFIYPLISTLFGFILNLYQSIDELLLGVSRLLFTLPIYLIVLFMPQNKTNSKNMIFFCLFIAVLASLTYPYQFLFGPIDWFVEPSDRSGMARYGSLFGNLTAYGQVIGFSFVLAILFVDKIFKLLFLLLIFIFGTSLSLQKAAIANVFIAIIFSIYLKRKNKKLRIVILLIIFIIFLTSLFYFDQVFYYVKSIRLFESIDSSTYSDDVSFETSIIDRITSLPLNAILYYPSVSMLFGIGPIAAGGTLGFSSVPMAHNGFVDLLLVGGIPYFLIFIFLIKFLISIKPSGLQSFDFYNTGFFILIMTVINLLFSNLIIFTPSASLFFALGIRYLCNCNNRQIYI